MVATRSSKAALPLTPAPTPPLDKNATVPSFTWKQVEEGGKLFVIDGKVYDVTEFIDSHPGGIVITTYLGKDASDVFHAIHNDETQAILADLYVGDLVDDQPAHAAEQKSLEFVQEVRKLRQKYKDMGLFESNKMYYIFKLASNLSIWGLSMYLVANYGNSTLAVIFAGLLCGLFWQQSGWLAHDVLHHQLFENRDLNRAWGYFVGNVCQGFSVAWWTDKHCTHHAVPNVHQEDPDIDTFPILAWSEHALTLFNELPDDVASRFFLKYQPFYFFPLLAFARVSWAAQSLLYAFDKTKKTMRNPLIEQVTLLIHYAWYFGVMYAFLDWKRAFLYFFFSQTGCGVMLAIVFSLNHNGMPIFTKDEFKDMDFFSLQVVTGRDVYSNLFSDWFTGGLNYQIEHHIFPTLPRHNFHLISADVKRLCKQYNIPYHATNMRDGTMEVLGRLHDVSTKM